MSAAPPRAPPARAAPAAPRRDAPADAAWMAILGVLGLSMAAPEGPLGFAEGVAAGGGLLVLGGAAQLARGRRAAAVPLWGVGLLALILGLAPAHADAPAAALLRLLLVSFALARHSGLLDAGPSGSALRSTALAGALAVPAALADPAPPLLGADVALFAVDALIVAMAGAQRATRPLAAGLGLTLIGLGVITAVGQGLHPSAYILIPLLALGADAAATRELGALLLSSPARLLVGSFAVLGLGGGALLALPVSLAPGAEPDLLRATFTAVSASCVTGLGVYDTGAHFSRFGQLVLLLLIQVGGLGIMTFAAAAVVGAGQRLSLRQESVAADLIGPDARADLRGALAGVLKVTLVTEGVGALLLFVGLLRHGVPAPAAAWEAVFTSISAFCNAGFALRGDSLMAFQRDPFVLFVVMALITAGALGPAVVLALPRLRRGRVSLRVRMALGMTALLVVVPALLILGFEWDNTLSGMSLSDRLSNAMFQSITLRTAGFNSIDLTQVRPSSWTLMVVTMFIGGSPGSTAGGVKTTTIAVLALAVRAAVEGRPEVSAGDRRLPHLVVHRAAAISTFGVLSVVVGLMALQLTQQMPLQVALFEVVSALATVGLTVGGTAALDEVGLVLVMGMMFAGRVGPLTLFMFFVGQAPAGDGARAPLEPVPVG